MPRAPQSRRWHEILRLPDGRELLVRPIRPEDAEPLRAGFALLTPVEIRHRFGHAMKELTPELAQRLARPDPTRELALVAAEPLPPGEAMVGAVARCAIDEDGQEAEFAILVAHHLAGQGLGRHLMKKLIRWARLKRLDALYGDVQADNTAMLDLARALGFRRERQPGDAGIVRVLLPLGRAVSPDRDEGDAPPR